jgi:hypothetical protein
MALKQQAHQLRFPSFPSCGLGTAPPKLELLHSCVPKLELGNKMQPGFSFDVERSMFDVRRSSLKTTQWHRCNPVFHSMFDVRCSTFIFKNNPMA